MYLPEGVIAGIVCLVRSWVASFILVTLLQHFYSKTLSSSLNHICPSLSFFFFKPRCLFMRYLLSLFCVSSLCSFILPLSSRTSAWGALTNPLSIFPSRDRLKFSFLHQYDNALGRHEWTLSKIRELFNVLMQSPWMTTGLFYHESEALWAFWKIRDLEWKVAVGTMLWLKWLEALRSINGGSEPVVRAAHWKHPPVMLLWTAALFFVNMWLQLV